MAASLTSGINPFFICVVYMSLENQNYAASTPPKPSSAPPHTTLQRSVRAAGPSRVIPRFHFPKGRPPPAHQQDHALHKVQSAFATFPNSQIDDDKYVELQQSRLLSEDFAEKM
ncbi:jg17113 [Pararge aegeria aegeria]|uniref:Jg17113 protein n=1 Tax=Pararge aegeria aegeria TaxID=348720 RepID=A0A8S4RWH2_9NEOP|nr:jg17113 [Pararge aegeria aegeria]